MAKNSYLNSSQSILNESGSNTNPESMLNKPNSSAYSKNSENVIDYYEAVLDLNDTSFVVVSDHAKMKNLDYEHSGHTGFASSKDLEQAVETLKESDNLQTEKLEALESKTDDSVTSLENGVAANKGQINTIQNTISMMADYEGSESELLWEDQDKWENN